MPVVLDGSRSADGLSWAIADARTRCAGPARATPSSIGLVNNMPDAALQATERQFRALLAAAAADRHGAVCILFSLPSVARGEAARPHLLDGRYRRFRRASGAPLDALIVTGAEPKRAVLARRALLGRPDAASFDWARAQHGLDDLVLPRGPCRRAASRRHRAPAPAAEALRRVRCTMWSRRTR